MFTGIIEETGKICEIKRESLSAKIKIQCRKVLEGTKIGDSIAVNGICLTVTSLGKESFTADVMAETMRRSSLSEIKVPGIVNLERAMAADGRFHGHIVSGHIDGTGTITRIQQEENAVWYTIGAEPELLRYIVEKGSVALDGISLTVAKVTGQDFQVSVIPHTRKETALSDKKSGSAINIECDMIGKYVEKLLTGEKKEKSDSKITEGFLLEHGFL
ncbi:MAG: riboflavin synthase [Lachnospiraceae bacterium]|nr:riboflavin synthase [Lachnospiraceae bacterium]